MIVWLAILVSVSLLSCCIGDEPETTVTVRRVKMSEDMNLEEPTPEDEEEAKSTALEDERVQTLLQGTTYELDLVGCRLSPDGEPQCILVLELENGEKYTIIVNITRSIVIDIREGDFAEQKDRGTKQKEEKQEETGEPP